MSYLKMLRAAVIAAAILMAITGTASAAKVTSPQGTTYTSSFRATAVNLSMHPYYQYYKVFSCEHSLLEGKVEAHGSEIPASGKLSKLTFSNCTTSITVKNNGSIQFNSNGTVASTGAEIVSHSSWGECVYRTNNTTLGTFTGGFNAEIDMNPAVIPRTGGSFYCGSSIEWTGNFVFSLPQNLWVD